MLFPAGGSGANSSRRQAPPRWVIAHGAQAAGACAFAPEPKAAPAGTCYSLRMKNITSALVMVVAVVSMMIVRPVRGQERPAVQTTVEPLRFHHVHLNSVDPVKAAEYYPKPFALSATRTTFNGRHRPVQYLNNILEQDHRAIKRRINAKQGFREFQAARRTIEGYEAMHMIRKGQARGVSRKDVRRQIQFINMLLELPA